MAGYVLKIVLEDTHPPVWRRVLIPEKITFEELHCVIQIVFGWTNDHLHDFRIPSQRIRIDNEARGRSYYHYIEDETLVDWFLLRYQWVRYTYDFGDEWRHKIIYEKTEESYEERYALLLKAKGDNFGEDSGGVWGIWENEGNRYAFDKIETEERLQNLILPAHDDLDEMMTPDLSKIDIEKIRRELLGKLSDNLKPDMRKSSAAAKPSRMAVKIDGWKQFIDDCYQNKNSGIKENSGYSQMVLPFLQEEPQKSEDTQEPETGDYVLEIVPGVKTCAELLKDLSLKETEDYCKYLQIPVPDTCSKKKMADAIAQEFERHPEYLLYVLEEDEYKELLSLIKSPYGRCEIPQQDDMLIKALGLGLADVAVEKDGGGTRAELSFARDSQSILKSLSVDVRKRIYREIYTFSERLRNIILVYGIVDFDNLFEMFEKIYHVTMERENFYRYIYWFARYNNLVHTAYLPEGTRYVAALQLDINSVLKKMVQYSDDLDYVIFSEKQLHMMTGEIEKRSMWFDALFTTLRYTLQFPESTALLMTKEVHCEIMNGHSLPVIMNHLSAKLPQEDYLTGICELWTIIVTLMFELELPMLKGRNREEYAEEKGISPWDIGMTDGESASYSLKEQHMYEFPVQIQKAMCLACNFADTQAMDMLWQYKKKERIQSEEYIYLLAQAFIMSDQYERADKVIRLLEKSSVRGKEAVPMLQEMVEQRLNIMDWEDDIMDDWDADAVDFQEDASWIVPRPYVRKAPKIGRNDPCPCGSGKKYKKCCGKNA